MVEAAFVTPVLMLLLFAIFEFSGYIAATTGAGAAVKAGSRMAVVMGNDPMADRNILNRINVEATGLTAGDNTIEEIKIWRATSIDQDPPAACNAASQCNDYVNPDYLGGAIRFAKLPLTSDSTPPATMGTGYADCYFGATTTTSTGCDGKAKLDANWPPTTRRTLTPPPGQTTCNDATQCPVDLVGIWIKARHSYYTGLFGSSVTVQAKTIAAIEPQGYDK